MLRLLLPMTALGVISPVSTLAADYKIDTSNSSITFGIRHMVINKVQGRYNTFSGTVVVNGGTDEVTALEGTIEANSIDTNDNGRDEHLRSPDFFDVEQYPYIRFTSTRIEVGESGQVAVGDLTMHGVTKEVLLPFVVVGPITDPWGNIRLGLEGQLEINRHDYGITWSQTLDGGGLVVADKVRIDINLEAVLRE